jgi:hypothetical protein
MQYYRCTLKICVYIKDLSLTDYSACQNHVYETLDLMANISGPFGYLCTHFITPNWNFVEVQWRSFFKVPFLASDALLTTLHPLVEHVLHTLDHFEISCLRAPFSWLEKSRNCTGRDLDYMKAVLMVFYPSTFSNPKTESNSYLAPCDLWASPTMKRELRG